MTIDTIKKGSMEMLVLLILQEDDVYGYQLSQLIQERSEGLLSIQEGALYPLLYRLTDNGYISGRDVTVRTKHGRTRNRVMYHLEEAGRQRLLELKRDYDHVQTGIQNVFKNSVVIGYEKPE